MNSDSPNPATSLARPRGCGVGDDRGQTPGDKTEPRRVSLTSIGSRLAEARLLLQSVAGQLFTSSTPDGAVRFHRSNTPESAGPPFAHPLRPPPIPCLLALHAVDQFTSIGIISSRRGMWEGSGPSLHGSARVLRSHCSACSGDLREGACFAVAVDTLPLQRLTHGLIGDKGPLTRPTRSCV